MGLDSSQGWATIFCCHHHATTVTPEAHIEPFALRLLIPTIQAPTSNASWFYPPTSSLVRQNLRSVPVAPVELSGTPNHPGYSEQALSSQNHEFSLLKPQSSA